ncbi:MAG: hypothetical protein Q7T11_00940 [Deltaproteobacteria bacterium]|nr:hypothetical protein [Deltaproteobacteria bacterium]
MRILLQIALISILMGGTLFCSDSGSNSKNKDDESDPAPTPDPDSDPDRSTSPEKTSLHETCFSCSQYATEGDTCGQALITGTSSDFSFTLESDQTTLDINGDIQLEGTYKDQTLDVAHDRWAYIGPGCNMTFTNLKITASIPTEQIETGWMGTFSYDFEPSPDDRQCDDTDFETCHAVHTVFCEPGC